jgi:hypothetical protein
MLFFSSETTLIHRHVKTIFQLFLCSLFFFQAQAQKVNIFTTNDWKQGLKNNKGEVLIKPQYDNLYIFIAGVVAANTDGRILDEAANADGGKWTFLDYDGKPLTKEVYDNAMPLVNAENNNFIVVNKGCTNPDGNYCKGGLWGIMDRSGKEIVALRYQKIQAELGADETMVASVKIKDKYGYIDAVSLQEITPIKYDEAYMFRWNQTANVRIGEKWGVINQTGKEIIPVIYDEISYFENGKVQVKQGDRTFYIDENGQEIK